MTDTNAPISRLQRALPASILLAIAAGCFYGMDMVSLSTVFPSSSNYIESASHDIKVPILQNFHWVPILDAVFRDITVAFAPSSFGFDEISRWQMMNFVNDIGPVYMVFLLESSRRGNRGTIIYYPAIMATLAQVVGGGIVVPIYYFLSLVFGRPVYAQSASERKIGKGDAWLSLLLVLGLHVVPAYAMYFAPLLEDRHLWTWFWQLYPVRITMAFYAFKVVGKIARFPPLFDLSYITTMVLILGSLVTIPTVQWLETLADAPYSLYNIFYPAPLSDFSFNARMRRCLQFDQLSVYISGMFWLAFLVWDMKVAKIVSTLDVVIFGASAILLSAALGPGAGFGLSWLLREYWLNGEEDDDAEKNE